MDKWEYLQVSSTIDDITDALNRVGDDGWELVHLHVRDPETDEVRFKQRAGQPVPKAACTAFLKRPRVN